MSLSIMGSRYIHLKLLLAGYAQTGVDLIEYDGTQFLPMVVSDDIGIYCIIPKLAYCFGLTIDQLIFIFFNTMTIMAFTIGLAGFYASFTSWQSRLVSTLGLTLLTLFVCTETIDVYRAYEAVAVAIIPWCLYFAQKKSVYRFFNLFVLCAGMGIGLAHYIRSHSGTAVLLFVLSIILTHAFINTRTKITLLCLLLIGIFIPTIYFKSTYNRHKQYAQDYLAGCRIDEGQHVFWHPIYLGFGYLTNDLGIRFDDTMGDQKVKSIAPQAPSFSAESELIMKQEVINLFKYHKYFFIYTIWAKIGVMLLFFLIFANLGIFAAYAYPLSWRLNLSFLLALGFNSLFGILVMPSTVYSIGFMSCAALFGITALDNALEQNIIGRWSSYLKRRFKHGKS